VGKTGHVETKGGECDNLAKQALKHFGPVRGVAAKLRKENYRVAGAGDIQIRLQFRPGRSGENFVKVY